MLFIEDIKTVFRRDPAARSFFEVMLLYPGLHAIWAQRIAHFFWRHRLYFVGRLISHIGRFITGIEIHPGAIIGRRFFIDHGMGVVIGETAEIGDDVLIYQGVVLGGTSLEKKKRHPTLANGVVVGAGAIVLGAITIGENSRIGAGSVVLHDIPADSTAVGLPAKVISDKHSTSDDEKLQHGKLPDPVAEAICLVLKDLEKMSARIQKIEKKEGIPSEPITEANKEFEEKKKEICEEFSE
jgi:serine O-acetyltransferase